MLMKTAIVKDGPMVNLTSRYHRGLTDYLNGAGESALQEAYELGRLAMTNGLGALDLARIHEETLLNVMENRGVLGAEQIRKASVFFAESLATFEMTHRGFQEALAIVSTRSAELEAANRALETEITERKKTQEELKSSEERYRSLVETALDVIYTLSTDGVITSLNSAFEQITGWPMTDWLDKPFLPLVHPQDSARCMQIYERLLHGETPPAFEVQVLTRSGEYIIGEFTTTPQWRNGKVVGVLGIARDITKRRKAEDQLRTSQLQLAEAQQIAHLGNWEWDVKNDTITWSAELYNIFGVTPGKFSPTFQTFLGLVHPDDRSSVTAVIENALKDKKPFSFHHRLVRPNGAVRISHSRGLVVTDRRGNPVKLVGTGQDVTEAKLAEEALHELPNKILNAQEVERRRLARELHDDVCQRLSGMRLSIDLLEHDIGENKKAMKKIDLAKRQVDQIITDIRRISWNLRPTTLDDLGLVVALQKLCQELRSTYKTQIKFSSSRDIPRKLNAEVEIALYRIAQESMMNALKHSKASEITVKLKREKSGLLLTVRDNGRGFDVTKARDERPGRGLGLMSMKERAHLLQGSCAIESKRMEGTTVRVYMPLERPQ